MILAIDMVGTSLGSGTRTFNVNFCKYLISNKIEKKIYIFISDDYLDYISSNENKNVIFVTKSKILKNIFFRILWMQILLPIELKRLRVDQLFSPMNMSPLVLKFFSIKVTLALHSNLPWVYFDLMPGNIFRNYLTKIFMQYSIYMCDSLIVDTYFAKNEISNILKIPKSKIYVIYLGIDKRYLSKKDNNFFLDYFDYSEYFLSVLSCVKYHNILNLLKAFKLFKKETNSKIRFVLVLQVLDIKYFSRIKLYIKDNFKTGEIIILKNLENSYLVNLYKKANFYIFSSYCEVFGLTSLEAMSQKCAVLISNKSALPEVNGNAADYFNPDDVIEIKEKIKKFVFDKKYKKEFEDLGGIHFKKFSWNITVKKTLEVLYN